MKVAKRKRLVSGFELYLLGIYEMFSNAQKFVNLDIRKLDIRQYRRFLSIKKKKQRLQISRSGF